MGLDHNGSKHVSFAALILNPAVLNTQPFPDQVKNTKVGEYAVQSPSREKRQAQKLSAATEELFTQWDGLVLDFSSRVGPWWVFSH